MAFVFGLERVSQQVLKVKGIDLATSTIYVAGVRLDGRGWIKLPDDEQGGVRMCAHVDATGSKWGRHQQEASTEKVEWTLQDDICWKSRILLGVWPELPGSWFVREDSSVDFPILQTDAEIVSARLHMPTRPEAIKWVISNATVLAKALRCTTTAIALVHLTGTPIVLENFDNDPFPELASDPSSLTLARVFVERAWALHGICPRSGAKLYNPLAASIGKHKQYTGGYNSPVNPARYMYDSEKKEGYLTTFLDIISSYPSIFAEYEIDIVPEVLFDIDGVEAKDRRSVLDNKAKKMSLWFSDQRRARPLPHHFLDAMALRRASKTNSAMWDATALKLRINSVYGAFSSPYFAYYAPLVSATIASIGREIIQELHGMSERLLHHVEARVVMGDTDCLVLVHRGGASFDIHGIMQLLKPLFDWTEERYRFIRLQVDRCFCICVIFAKKHYIGLDIKAHRIWNGWFKAHKTPESLAKFLLTPEIQRETFVVKGIETQYDTVCKFAKTIIILALWYECIQHAKRFDPTAWPSEAPPFIRGESGWALSGSHASAYTIRHNEPYSLVVESEQIAWMVSEKNPEARDLASDWYIRRQLVGPIQRASLNTEVAEKTLSLFRDLYKWESIQVKLRKASVSWNFICHHCGIKQSTLVHGNLIHECNACTSSHGFVELCGEDADHHLQTSDEFVSALEQIFRIQDPALRRPYLVALDAAATF